MFSYSILLLAYLSNGRKVSPTYLLLSFIFILMYINDLPVNVEYHEIFLFADNTPFVFKRKTVQWMHSNKLCINKDKT